LRFYQLPFDELIKTHLYSAISYILYLFVLFLKVSVSAYSLGIFAVF